MSVDWELYDYYRRDSAEKYEKLNNCYHLLGKYSYHAEQDKADPKLVEMVRELEAVLNGTWRQSEVTRSDKEF